MIKMISRRLFFQSLFATAAIPAFANPPSTSLRPRARAADHYKKAVSAADRLIADAKLGGRVAFAVADVKTGLVLEENDANIGLPPASVAKAVTALYALKALGANHRFETTLVADGTISGGILTGDLILVGGGDPTLDTDRLAAMAADLKAAGIKEVRGRFMVYGGALPKSDEIDSDQPDHVGYNPAVSGLNLNYNRVHFQWVRAGQGYTVTMDARSERYRPDVRVARMSIVNRAAPVYTYKKAPDRDQWTVAKSALGKSGSRWLPVRKPEMYAGEVFQTFAGSHGITLRAPVLAVRRPKGTVLVRHKSVQLRTILKDMLKYSTNLTAEVVGMAATQKLYGQVSGIAASARAMSQWAAKDLGMTGAKFVDHSGLGDRTRITVAALVKGMVSARKDGISNILKNIPLRDAKGRPIKQHPIKVRAKTGTLNFVSGLAGYMVAKDGTELAFAIVAADLPRRDRLKPEQKERPDGGGAWNKRAKKLQQKLIERWGALYGA